MYEYRAAVLRVVDGDTVDVAIDLGFGVEKRERVRLSGLDAPEQNTSDGMAATRFVQDWVAAQPPVASRFGYVLRSKRPEPKDRYARYLAELFSPSGESLNAALIEAGHAVRV